MPPDCRKTHLKFKICRGSMPPDPPSIACLRHATSLRHVSPKFRPPPLISIFPTPMGSYMVLKSPDESFFSVGLTLSLKLEVDGEAHLHLPTFPTFRWATGSHGCVASRISAANMLSDAELVRLIRPKIGFSSSRLLSSYWWQTSQLH